MKIITNPEHVQILRNLRRHPKYIAYTATQFSELVRLLFPEYREAQEITQEIQEVIGESVDHSNK